jgi:hypothetical protein
MLLLVFRWVIFSCFLFLPFVSILCFGHVLLIVGGFNHLLSFLSLNFCALTSLVVS